MPRSANRVLLVTRSPIRSGGLERECRSRESAMTQWTAVLGRMRGPARLARVVGSVSGGDVPRLAFAGGWSKGASVFAPSRHRVARRRAAACRSSSRRHRFLVSGADPGSSETRFSSTTADVPPSTPRPRWDSNDASLGAANRSVCGRDLGPEFAGLWWGVDEAREWTDGEGDVSCALPRASLDEVRRGRRLADRGSRRSTAWRWTSRVGGAALRAHPPGPTRARVRQSRSPRAPR